MNPLQRRDFMLGAAASVSTAGLVRGATGPNEKVGVAIVGTGRGRYLADYFSQLPDCQVVAICDVDENWGQPVVKKLESKTGKRPAFVVDYRRLLERSDVDALVVATPDHWHAPMTINACLAGKDVYCEKPASHNILEGRLAVRAARKHERIVQHGTNLRSVSHYKEAWQLLNDGVIGKVMMVKAINNQRVRPVPHRPDEPVPQGVHYDLWLGPAPKRPFNRNRFHGVWHFMYDFGTGEIGNDGVHQIDLGRWAMGLQAPKAVTCSAAKLGSKGDAQEFPDTMNVTWEYEDLLFVFEQRLFTPYRMRDHRVDNDNIFFGDEGYMMIDRDGYRVFYKEKRGPAKNVKWKEDFAHYQNFIDCVKSRRREDLVADIEEGHTSALLCHLGNIAYRTGRRLEFNAETETFSDPEANQYLGREYRKGFELPKV